MAAYTLTGVGKKSEAIAVNTTFGKVVFNRIQFHLSGGVRSG